MQPTELTNGFSNFRIFFIPSREEAPATQPTDQLPSSSPPQNSLIQSLLSRLTSHRQTVLPTEEIARGNAESQREQPRIRILTADSPLNALIIRALLTRIFLPDIPKHLLETDEIQGFSKLFLEQMIQVKNGFLQDPVKRYSADDIEGMLGNAFQAIHTCGLYHLILKATLVTEPSVAITFAQAEEGKPPVTLSQNPQYNWLTEALIEIKKELTIMNEKERASLLDFLSYKNDELPKENPKEAPKREVVTFKKIIALKFLIDKKIINFDDRLPKEKQIPWLSAFTITKAD